MYGIFKLNVLANMYLKQNSRKCSNLLGNGPLTYQQTVMLVGKLYQQT